MNLSISQTGGPVEVSRRLNRSIGTNYPYPEDKPPLPATSLFLSSDDDTTDSDSPDTPPSPTHGTPFTKITSSTQRSPVIPRRRVMILASGQPIPHG
ncbi:hypothetical protein Tco_0989737 [Tanacetum coccineum]|uniref:Uncharacterized protein n=1 Tax=Tanacetum coccineum TaxID=301880 RepID=A0ABQ5EV26_9ASTR